MSILQEKKELGGSKKSFLSNSFILKSLILFCVIGFLFFTSKNGFAAQLINRKVTLSDSKQSIANTRYTFQWTGTLGNLKCFKILFCRNPGGVCNTPAGLNTILSTKGTWVGLTSANWTLDNTVNGTLKLTNLAGENPAANLTLEFRGITNPANVGTYYNRITTYSDGNCLIQVDYGNVAFRITGPGINITITVPGVPPPPPPPPGGGGGTPPPTYSKVIFEGKAYPGALITVLRNGAVAGTTIGLPTGDFSLTLGAVQTGISTFGIFAEDTQGRKSVTLSFSISVIEGTTTTVKGIFISPTIELSKQLVKRGDSVDVLGQAYPESEVQIFVSSGPTPFIKKATPSLKGEWKYSLDTSILGIGDHSSKAKAIADGGEQSPFSSELPFKVVEMCKGADLNFDGRVNLTDFSILLYFWNQTKPKNICADINFDGIVNIVDFSITMYYWTR